MTALDCNKLKRSQVDQAKRSGGGLFCDRSLYKYFINGLNTTNISASA